MLHAAASHSIQPIVRNCIFSTAQRLCVKKMAGDGARDAEEGVSRGGRARSLTENLSIFSPGYCMEKQGGNIMAVNMSLRSSTSSGYWSASGTAGMSGFRIYCRERTQVKNE
jgi:hypothetical protein